MNQAPDQIPAARSSRGPLLALWASLLVTVGVGLPRIFGTSISIDEAYSMDTAGRSLAGTLHQATHFELQPPLYFLLLNLWLRLHRSPEFARLFSLGCILLALLLLYRVGRRLGGDIGAAILPLFAALSAPIAWSAVTERGYGLTLLLLVACCHGFVGVWCSDRPASRWDLPVFIVAGVAATYTFYYSGFAVAGLFAGALLSGRRRRELLIAAVCVAVAVLPLVPLVLLQSGAHPTQPEGDARQPPLQSFLVSRLFGLFFWTGQLRHPPGRVLLAALVLAVAIVRARDGAPRWSRRETLWLVAAIIPWLLLLGVEQSGTALVLPRHRVVILPAALLLLAVILDGIRHPLRRRVMTMLTLATFGIFFLSYQRNREDFDWRAAAALIASREAAGEPVVVFTSDGVLPLRWEYHGPNTLVPLPGEPDVEHYDPAERYLHDTLQVRQRIESAVAPGQSFWLVRRQWLPQPAGDSLLTQYLRDETVRLGEWKVPGIDLFRLRRAGN